MTRGEIGECDIGIPKDITNSREELRDWSILSCYRGSIAHGMYVPQENPDSIDDKDAMVVIVPPMDHYYGLKSYASKGTREIKVREWDIVVYEFRKFVRLLAKGNPNVLSALWLEPKNYMRVTEAGQMLLDNRELFVGKHVYRSFTGYAHGQFHRMEHFPDSGKGYMGEKRKRLVERHGYDTKNAAHLIRLLKMGIEFLNDGRLYVERQDAQYLLDIKRGKRTLEWVKAEADRLFGLAEDAFTKSSLPVAVDMEAINKLCVEIVTHVNNRRQSG